MALSLLAALIVAGLPVFGWTAPAQSAVAAFVLAVSGAAQAFLVGGADRFLPLLVGLGEALIAVLAAFRFEIPAHYLTAGMAILTVVSGLATRPQVQPHQVRGDRPLAVTDERDPVRLTSLSSETVRQVDEP